MSSVLIVILYLGIKLCRLNYVQFWCVVMQERVRSFS